MGSHLETVALRKGRAKPEEAMCGWRIVGSNPECGDVLVTFGTFHVLTRGPRKGRRRWNKPLREVVVTEAEVRDEERAYEATSGHCHRCHGKGAEWAGWSAKTGTKTAPCRRCGATGIAPRTEE